MTFGAFVNMQIPASHPGYTESESLRLDPTNQHFKQASHLYSKFQDGKGKQDRKKSLSLRG